MENALRVEKQKSPILTMRMADGHVYAGRFFVAEWARKHGVGRRLMSRLAAIALERGWARFDLSVLHWNPARQFYHRLGMRHLEEWLPYRIDGAALQALAEEDAKGG